VKAVPIYSTRLAFPEVDMMRTAFTQTSIDASTGAHVHFVNPSNGMEQILCVGTNGHCASVGLDPRELLGTGLRVEAGQTVTVVFPDSGDFPITSKTMPGMNMTIHVQDNSSGD
jgi:plastocyanin